MNRFVSIMLVIVGVLLSACGAHSTPNRPVFGSSDQAVYASATQTLTHKTIDCSDNTCLNVPTWMTDLDCDLTAQSNQTFSTDATYTICGKTWKKENSAQEATASSIINGTGLEFTNYTGDYGSQSQLGGGGSSDRSAPLLWMALSQLSIAGLDWSTQFRIWIDIPTQTIDSAGHVGIAVGIDNDVGHGFGSQTTWFSIFGARASNGTSTPIYVTWEYSGSPGSGATPTSAPSGVTTWNTANQTSVVYLGALVPAGGTYQPAIMFGTAWSAGWTNLLVPWATRQDQANPGRGIAPSIGYANSTSSPATIGSELGVVLAFTGNRFETVQTIVVAHLRIDHRL